MKTKTLHPNWTVIGITAGISAAYALVIRPRIVKRWGAIPDETNAIYPGDEIISRPKLLTTRAVAIAAPPEAIWPWLMQIGYQRAGWYSYDALERLVGVADFAGGHHSAREILPDLQDLQPGDQVRTHPDGGFIASLVEPNRMLVLRAKIHPLTAETADLDEPLPGSPLSTSWGFYLQPVDSSHTRLIARFRVDYPDHLGLDFGAHLLLEPVVFLMERKMLL